MVEYRRVAGQRDAVSDDAIKVTSNGSIRSFIGAAVKLLSEGKEAHILGAGMAIDHAIRVSERARRCMKGVHQVVSISSSELKDKYEPVDKEEGDAVERSRIVPSIVIVLSTSTKGLDLKSPGYHAPLPESEIKEVTADEFFSERSPRRGGDRPRERRSRDTGSPRGDGHGRGSGDHGRGSGEHARRSERGPRNHGESHGRQESGERQHRPREERADGHNQRSESDRPRREGRPAQEGDRGAPRGERRPRAPRVQE